MQDEDVPMLVDTSLGQKTSVSESVKKVPVTVVTGYLGSGKSTLLKYITQNNSGKKIAIILNEFGDSADIEKSLTVTEDNTPVEEWLELDNGCLCCTAKDAGVTAIENLMKRKGKFDYILLETTGIADPAPIASMFWLDEALDASLDLDGIVTVVDGLNIIKSIETGETARVQIACADVIIVNKCDLLSTEQLAGVEHAVRQINAAATLVNTEFGVIEPAKILDLAAYSTLDSFNVTEAQHDTDITTVTIPLEVTSHAEFEKKLQLLLWEDTFQGHELEFHRIKARVTAEGSTKIIQGVRSLYDTIETEYSSEPSKIVIIGRGIKKQRKQLIEYFTQQ